MQGLIEILYGVKLIQIPTKKLFQEKIEKYEYITKIQVYSAKKNANKLWMFKEQTNSIIQIQNNKIGFY